MKNSHKNNHFLQKAIVKHFAKNGKIKWINYKTNDGGTFNINSKNQPIAIDNFYSKNIEIGMNNLESEGIRVIRKIAQNAQYEKEISLFRKELKILQFYSLLSYARTNKFRKDIEQNNSDLFIKKRKMDILLKKFKKNKYL